MANALGDLASAHSFIPDYGHLTIFGTCTDCAGAESPV